MSEMSNQNSENTDVYRARTVGEGSSPGRRCLVGQQGPSRHSTTVKTMWSKNVNKIVLECFFRSKTFDDDGKPIRGYRQQMMQKWKEHGVFEITEKRLCDQPRAIKKNSWLSDLELENIRRMIEAESDVVNESIEDVEENQTERGIERTTERNEQIVDNSDETINNVAVNGETLDEKTQLIIAQLNKILAGSRNTDGASFKKVDMNTLNRTTAKVNRVIELIETKNITQTNNLIKAAGV